MKTVYLDHVFPRLLPDACHPLTHPIFVFSLILPSREFIKKNKKDKKNAHDNKNQSKEGKRLTEFKKQSKQRKVNQNVNKIKLGSFCVAQPHVGMGPVLECGW